MQSETENIKKTDDLSREELIQVSPMNENNQDPTFKQKKPVTNAAVKNFFTSKFLLSFFMVGTIFLLGYVIGGAGAVTENRSVKDVVINGTGSGSRVDFGLFWKAWDTLGDHYVDSGSLDPQALVYGAIKGMYAATGDPYTTFFDPQVNEAFSEDMSGQFEGIGAEIGIEDSFLIIIAPLDGSPAAQSGLRAGDRIIQIDGVISADISVEDAVKRIRGDKGTDVILTIFREGENDTRDITVTRDTIEIKSVTVETREDGIATIRVSQFGGETTRLFRSALSDLLEKNTQEVIIDLRNNPGGYLDGAIAMIGYFVPKGSIAVIEQAANGTQNPRTTKGDRIVDPNMKIVILINQGSASASEIFAAALKEQLPNVVTLVGETSFGKGSVQELIPMEGGTAAKITIAKWLTSQGKEIDGVGIGPDVEIEYTNEDFEAERDPQMDGAAAVLRGAYSPEVEVVREDLGKAVDEESTEVVEEEVQLSE